MEPASATALALTAKAGSNIFGGMAASEKSKGVQQQAQMNALNARTRAMQADTVAQENMNSELGTMRAAIGANGEAPSVGTMEMVRELRRTRNRERNIQYGNYMSEAADWDMRGRNAAYEARASRFGGFMRAVPSLFDLAQLGG